MNDINLIKLLNCPFCCTGDALEVEEIDLDTDHPADSEYVVMCGNCGAHGPITPFETTAKLLWNAAHVNARPQFSPITIDFKAK